MTINIALLSTKLNQGDSLTGGTTLPSITLNTQDSQLNNVSQKLSEVVDKVNEIITAVNT